MVQIVAGQQPKSLKIAPFGAFFISDELCLVVVDVIHANRELVVSL